MDQEYTSLPYIISNIAAVCVVITAMIWPTVARVLLSSIFVAASAINLFTAVYLPSAYLYFGESTSSEVYRSVILEPFSQHVQLYVCFIAICQLLIGILIAYKGKLMNIAMVGGMFFLVAISPIGYGAAFPAPLILALAIVILMSKKIKLDIYEISCQKSNFSSK